MMRQRGNKDNYIQFLIESAVKEEFFKLCDEDSINPSEWLRKQVERFIRARKDGAENEQAAASGMNN